LAVLLGLLAVLGWGREPQVLVVRLAQAGPQVEQQQVLVGPLKHTHQQFLGWSAQRLGHRLHYLQSKLRYLEFLA
jgi:hypothetical protein